MNLRQIKNDLKASLQTENYYAETEFYRLVNDVSIPHESRISLLKEQLTRLTNTINGQRLVDALLPEADQSPSDPTAPEENPDQV